MSKKDNIRSFRYSSEVAAILEAQEGKSLNDKFENLVLTCFYKLSDVQKQLDAQNMAIIQNRKYLAALLTDIEKLSRISAGLDLIRNEVTEIILTEYDPEWLNYQGPCFPIHEF